MFAGISAWALLVLTFAEFVRLRIERVVAARKIRAEARKRRGNEERLRIAREQGRPHRVADPRGSPA